MKIIAYFMITAFFILQTVSGIKKQNKDKYKKIEIIGSGLAAIGGLVIIVLELIGPNP